MDYSLFELLKHIMKNIVLDMAFVLASICSILTLLKFTGAILWWQRDANFAELLQNTIMKMTMRLKTSALLKAETFESADK